MKLRSFGVTCLFFVGGFAAVLAFQTSREPRGAEHRMPPPPSTIAAGLRAVEASPRLAAGAATVAGAAQASSVPAQASVKPKAETVGPRTDAGDVSEPAAPPAAVLANDPIARIQQLSYTALSGDSRIKRLVALSSLEAMAYRGEEVAQIKAALAYSMDNVDPMVAARARALYDQIDAGK